MPFRQYRQYTCQVADEQVRGPRELRYLMQNSFRSLLAFSQRLAFSLFLAVEVLQPTAQHCSQAFQLPAPACLVSDLRKGRCYRPSGRVIPSLLGFRISLSVPESKAARDMLKIGLHFMYFCRNIQEKMAVLFTNSAGTAWGRTVLVVALSIVVALSSAPRVAQADFIAPYRDGLFAYPPVTDYYPDGSFLRVSYDKQRDIYKRDKTPERRAHRKYVKLLRARDEAVVDVQLGQKSYKIHRVGTRSNATFAVIFIHGRGGDYRLGANDWSFGGNFNRLKNLALRNNGIYIAPTMPDFEERGQALVELLLNDIEQASPGARIVIACGSMGSQVCWRLADSNAIVSRLKGMFILGGAINERYFASAAHARRLPLYLGHGSEDSVYDWRRQKAFFDRLREGTPDYPARFLLFDTGSHGTPIRMVDWRSELNWMLGNG